jgi:hypothetical protein
MTRRIVLAAPEAAGRAVDLIRGPEGLFPSFPSGDWTQQSLSLLSTLIDGIDHRTAVDRLQPLGCTAEGASPSASLFELPAETRDHLAALELDELPSVATRLAALEHEGWSGQPAKRTSVLLAELRAVAVFAQSTGRTLFLWQRFEFRRRSES